MKATPAPTFQEIADATDRNDHNEALLLGLNYFFSGSNSDSNEIKEAERLISDHKRRGHMGEDLRWRRNDLYDKMMETAKETFGAESDLFKKFHGAF